MFQYNSKTTYMGVIHSLFRDLILGNSIFKFRTLQLFQLLIHHKKHFFYINEVDG